MGFKDILKKAFKKDEKFKEMQREVRMRQLIEERQKNANERELERYFEEKRQERIKEELEKFRKEQRDEYWKAGMLNGERSVLRQDFDLLKQKNIFEVKADNLSGGNMFLK